MAGTVSIGGGYYVNLPKFGAGPSGRRSERVLNSPNWDGSEFENYEPILNIVKHSEDDEEDMWGGFVIQSGGYTIRQGISAMVD